MLSGAVAAVGGAVSVPAAPQAPSGAVDIAGVPDTASAQQQAAPAQSQHPECAQGDSEQVSDSRHVSLIMCLIHPFPAWPLDILGRALASACACRELWYLDVLMLMVSFVALAPS